MKNNIITAIITLILAFGICSYMVHNSQEKQDKKEVKDIKYLIDEINAVDAKVNWLVMMEQVTIGKISVKKDSIDLNFLKVQQHIWDNLSKYDTIMYNLQNQRK